MVRTLNCYYLAGKMSGVKHHNYPKFKRAQLRLEKHGYHVINPANLNTIGDAWNLCLRNDIKYIVTRCKGIALLDDWMLSPGARLELAIAIGLGMDIIDAHTLRPLKITLDKLFQKHRRSGHVERYKG